ncbi:MAG: uracil-DNA glycosylase [Gammaproteobacteria bacterium]
MRVPPQQFDPDCTRCPRLADFLAEVRREHPDYHARPVPPFGDPQGQLLIVGLAPGMHGANATGRPFTGDYAGILLYRALHDAGFASRPVSRPGDDLELRDCRITNAVKCLPPQNKPTTAEVDTCNQFLRAEIDTVGEAGVLLALGAIAHRAVLKALAMKLNASPFGHAAEHALPGGRVLLDSYHCSRYNTQTRRLTDEMFHAVIRRAKELRGG